MPNIVEEYINQKKQMVILLLGPQGSKKSELAKMLNNDFKFKLIKINDYYKSDNYVEKEIDNIKLKIYEHTDNYDWDKLSDVVNKYKSTGVILYGNNIDIDKINFKIDFVFFTSVKNQLYKEYIIKHNILDTKKEYYINLYINNYITPLYENLKSKLKINKFFNIKENTDINDTYKELFDILINTIKKIINSY